MYTSLTAGFSKVFLGLKAFGLCGGFVGLECSAAAASIRAAHRER